MAKIIPFPTSPGSSMPSGTEKPEPFKARTQTAAGTGSSVPGKIISFAPGNPAASGNPTLDIVLKAGIDPSRGLDKSAPEWAVLVHLSRWWRLAAVIVDELTRGPVKSTASSPVSEEVLLRLKSVRGTGADENLEEDFSQDLDEVLWTLQDKNILVQGKRGIYLETDAMDLAEHPWVLWAELFDAGQNGRPWISPFHKKLGPFYQTQISKSLGLIRAVAPGGSITPSQLMEFADLNLDFEAELSDLGIQLPKSEEAFKSRNRPGIAEKEWYRLVINGFAVPMGLVEIRDQGIIHLTPLLELL